MPQARRGGGILSGPLFVFLGSLRRTSSGFWGRIVSREDAKTRRTTQERGRILTLPPFGRDSGWRRPRRGCPAPEARQRIGPGVSPGSPVPPRPEPQRGDRIHPSLLRCPLGSCGGADKKWDPVGSLLSSWVLCGETAPAFSGRSSSHAKNRPSTERVFCSNERAVLQCMRRVRALGLQIRGSDSTNGSSVHWLTRRRP